MIPRGLLLGVGVALVAGCGAAPGPEPDISIVPLDFLGSFADAPSASDASGFFDAGPQALDGGIADLGPQGDLADGVSVSGMIGSGGGTLSHPDGAKLIVPAGALAVTKTITITAVPAPAARGFRWVGPVFRFEPSGLTFAVPASLILAYEGARVGLDVDASVRVYHAPGTTTRFAAVPSASDVNSHTVTGKIGSFSSGGAGIPVADRTHVTPFQPRDLGFSPGFVWVMGDGTAASSGLAGVYLYRVDAAAGTAAKWIGESMVFSGVVGPTWFDGWGVWVNPSSSEAWFSGSLQNGTAWTLNLVSLGGAPNLSRSWFEVYRAPASGTATTLHGVTRNAAGMWATFQGCGQLYQTLAPTVADTTSTGPCTNRPHVLVGNQTVKLNDCNYGASFGTRFGVQCATFIDFAPSAKGANDVVASDGHQRIVYLARNADFAHATLLGVTGYNDTPGYRDGPAWDSDMTVRALVNGPQGIAVAADGTIYFADTANHAVRRVTAASALAWDTVTTVYGGPTAGTLASPQSVTLEPGDGALWISDSGNKRLIRILLP